MLRAEDLQSAKEARRRAHPKLRRLIVALLWGTFIVMSLRAVHWAAMQYVMSSGSQSVFAEIRLQQGLSKADVMAKLGPPDAQLHTAAGSGEAGPETIRYVRGGCELELCFVDGRLISWAETEPIDFAQVEHARKFTLNCCGPAKEQEAETAASVLTPPAESGPMRQSLNRQP